MKAKIEFESTGHYSYWKEELSAPLKKIKDLGFKAKILRSNDKSGFQIFVEPKYKAWEAMKDMEKRLSGRKAAMEQILARHKQEIEGFENETKQYEKLAVEFTEKFNQFA
jgi:hypothetical protein